MLPEGRYNFLKSTEMVSSSVLICQNEILNVYFLSTSSLLKGINYLFFCRLRGDYDFSIRHGYYFAIKCFRNEPKTQYFIKFKISSYIRKSVRVEETPNLLLSVTLHYFLIIII